MYKRQSTSSQVANPFHKSSERLNEVVETIARKILKFKIEEVEFREDCRGGEISDGKKNSLRTLTAVGQKSQVLYFLPPTTNAPSHYVLVLHEHCEYYSTTATDYE